MKNQLDPLSSVYCLDNCSEDLPLKETAFKETGHMHVILHSVDHEGDTRRPLSNP